MVYSKHIFFVFFKILVNNRNLLCLFPENAQLDQKVLNGTHKCLSRSPLIRTLLLSYHNPLSDQFFVENSVTSGTIW